MTTCNVTYIDPADKSQVNYTEHYVACDIPHVDQPHRYYDPFIWQDNKQPMTRQQLAFRNQRQTINTHANTTPNKRN